MNEYLGEFPIEISAHPIYSKYTRADWAMYFITTYGQIDGSHHKQWVLDQVARCLTGVPIFLVEARWSNGDTEERVSTGNFSAEYYQWIKKMLGEEKDGEFEYDYDEGIAP